MATPAYPIICWKSHLETYGISAITSEESGFPKENLYDWRLQTLWKPTSTATQNITIDKGAAGIVTDYFCIQNHDLGTRTATVTIYEDDNSGFTSPTTLGTKAFTLDSPYFLSLTSGTERYNRIAITSLDAACYIGEIFLGAKLTMQKLPLDGYDVDDVSVVGKASASHDGNFLGAQVLYKQRNVNAAFRYLTDAWVLANLKDFLDDHYSNLKPFFYIPDATNYTDRVYFVRAPDNTRVSLPSESTFRHWDLQAIGIKDADFTT